MPVKTLFQWLATYYGYDDVADNRQAELLKKSIKPKIEMNDLDAVILKNVWSTPFLQVKFQ